MYEVRGVLSEVIVPEMVASCGSIDECLNEDGTVDGGVRNMDEAG